MFANSLAHEIKSWYTGFNAINDDVGGITEFVIAGNEYLASENAIRIRFAHALLVNKRTMIKLMDKSEPW